MVILKIKCQQIGTFGGSTYLLIKPRVVSVAWRYRGIVIGESGPICPGPGEKSPAGGEANSDQPHWPWGETRAGSHTLKQIDERLSPYTHCFEYTLLFYYLHQALVQHSLLCSIQSLTQKQTLSMVIVAIMVKNE